ncbi:MAG: BlaI/MecI/CopY family transcriptional regulator [Isosphaeraceae bacterium]
MARPTTGQPTEGELEILGVLWKAGPAELGTIRAALQESRPVAATTVATMLKVMLDKGLVNREDGPRGYLWSAAVSLESARSGLLGRLLDLVFDGSARRLVAHMVERGDLTDSERAEIRRMLDARTAEGRRKAPKPKGGQS